MAKASKSRLLSKFKKASKGTFKRRKGQGGRAKGAQLPGGIIRGVAQFDDWEIAEDKKGTTYFKLSATVKDPEDYAGVKCSIFHRLKETQTKTVQDKVDELRSDIVLLGADPDMSEEDIETELDALKDSKPHFFFNTFKPEPDARNPNPSTYVFVQGLAEDWDEEEPEEDESEESDEGEEDEAPFDDEDADEDEEGDEDEGDADSEEDEDEEPDEDEEEDEEGDDEEEDWEPVKGDVWKYKASPRGKAQECEVMTVNKTKQTVKLKRTTDGKTFPNVPWDKLEE